LGKGKKDQKGKERTASSKNMYEKTGDEDYEVKDRLQNTQGKKTTGWVGERGIEIFRLHRTTKVYEGKTREKTKVGVWGKGNE